MSFFFSQHKKTEKKNTKVQGNRPSAVNKQNAETLNRLGCKGCPLNNADVVTPKMKPTLAKETLVYFLTASPDQYEDETSGKPLTGPSGKLLRECLPKGTEKHCSFDNVVRDHTPENRTPTWVEMECCRQHVVSSIEAAKPSLIIGLGAIPLSWMIGSMDVTGMRGRLFAVKVGKHACWFMPTFDPKFILSTAFDKRKPLNSKFGHSFRMDLKRAFNNATKLKPPKIVTPGEVSAGIECYDGTGSGHLEALLKALAVAKKAPLKAIDLETSTLRPYAAKALLLTASISYKGHTLSFAIDHPKAGWDKVSRETILKAFKGLLVDNTVKVAHNAPFELEWLISYFGKDVVNHNAWECTMMQAHVLDERKGGKEDDDRRATYQSLDFLCMQHFGIAYKKLFKLNKKDMASEDLTKTLIYNGADTKMTLLLHTRQIQLLEEQGTIEAYYDSLPRQPTVALMQHLGVLVDQNEIKTSQEKLGKEIQTLTDEIFKLKVVKDFISDRKEFNPLSGQDAVTIFKDYLKRDELLVEDKHTKERKFKTDRAILEKIDHPLAELIIKLRNRTKMKSTYIDSFELGAKDAVIYPDGKIHTNFNTTFTTTGRLSSDDPNLQNFPYRTDPWVRKPIIAPPGYVLVAFDYGQLEGCTAAICSGDKVLIKALWEDYDIHMEWAERTAAKYPEIVGGKDKMKDKKVAKTFRSRIKNKLVFPAIFGATSNSIAGYLTMPEEIIKDLMDDFWSQFSGLKKWQDNLMKRYYDEGFVETPNGRRRWYPMTRNEAINSPIQGFAAEIVCSAMTRLSFEAKHSGKWYLHPHLNIHDDLTQFIPNKNSTLEDAIQQIYTIMLTPPYGCINVPLSVSASIGKNWYEVEEIGKFWSHKDL